MTRGLIVLAGALILAVNILPGTIVAQEPPPHKDPGAETSQASALSLLGYFGMIMDFLADGDFGDASELLDQLRHANIPDDLRFIIDRYAELLGGLGNDLDSAERSLGRASALLGQGDRPAAQRQLEAAGASLSAANGRLEDLQLATDTVARRLGVFGAAFGSPVREAYDRLQALLFRLDELRARYAATLEELDAAVEAPMPSATLAPTVAPAPQEEPVVTVVAPATPMAPAVAGPALEAASAPTGDIPGVGGISFRFSTTLTVIILSVAAAYLAAALVGAWYRQRKRPSPVVAGGQTDPSSDALAPAVIGGPTAALTWTYVDPVTPQGRVVAAYHRAAQLLESSLAVAYQPYFTLRDFVLALGTRVTGAFLDLTRVAERALYASSPTDEEEARRAEHLVQSVQEDLS